jgi:hypothetical protein
MKNETLLTGILISVFSAGCASTSQRTLTAQRTPSNKPSLVSPSQVTQAYNSVSSAILAMAPKTTECGPGFDSSSTCYQGKDGCTVVVSYISTGLLNVYVDAAQRPPYPTQCDMTLISPSHTIQSLTTQTRPYLLVRAVTTTTPDKDDGPKTTDPCSIAIQKNTVTTTTNQGSTSCELGN